MAVKKQSKKQTEKVKYWSSDLTGRMRVYAQEVNYKKNGKPASFLKFSTSIGIKNEDGEWDNLYFKFSEQNLCDIEHLKQFDQLPFSPKVVFTSKDYGLESQVIFKEYIGQIGGVTNDTQLFRKYINLIRVINKKTFKQRQ